MTANLSTAQASPRTSNQDSLYSETNSVTATVASGVFSASSSVSSITQNPPANCSLVSLSTTTDIPNIGAPPATSSFWASHPSSFETICKIMNVQPHLLIIPCPHAKHFSQTRLIDYQAFCKLVEIDPDRVLSKMLYVRVESRYFDTFFVNIETKTQPVNSNKEPQQKDQEKALSSETISVDSKLTDSSSTQISQVIENILDPSEELVEPTSFNSTLSNSISKPKEYGQSSLVQPTMSSIPQNLTSYHEFCKSFGSLDSSKVSTFQHFLSFNSSSSSNSLPLAFLEHIISKPETPTYNQFCQSNSHLEMDSLSTMKSYIVSLVTDSQDFFEPTGLAALDQNDKSEAKISSEKLASDTNDAKGITEQRKRKFSEIQTPLE